MGFGIRTRIAVAALLLASCSLLSVRCNPKVGSEKVLGLVLEINAVGIQSTPEDAIHSRVLIAAGDSSEFHLLLPPPEPRPGDFIPLQAEYFQKGDVEYSLDLEKWLEVGPS